TIEQSKGSPARDSVGDRIASREAPVRGHVGRCRIAVRKLGVDTPSPVAAPCFIERGSGGEALDEMGLADRLVPRIAPPVRRRIAAADDRDDLDALERYDA